MPSDRNAQARNTMGYDDDIVPIANEKDSGSTSVFDLTQYTWMQPFMQDTFQKRQESRMAQAMYESELLFEAEEADIVETKGKGKGKK